MSPSIPLVKLNNGQSVPLLAIGCFMSQEGVLERYLYEAITIAGYRWIDTAHFFGTEARVGSVVKRVIAEGRVKREDLVISTRISPHNMRQQDVERQVKESLTNLGVDKIDLLLILMPVPYYCEDTLADQFSNNFANIVIDDSIDIYTESWPAMEAAVDEGLVTSIGACSFNAQQIATLYHKARIKPVLNMTESSPLLPEVELLDVLRERNMLMWAFSPFGGKLMDETKFSAESRADILFSSPLIKSLASKYGKSAAQVMLRFQVQRGVAVSIHAIDLDLIIEDTQIFDFQLAEGEMQAMQGLQIENGRTFQLKHLRGSKYYPF